MFLIHGRVRDLVCARELDWNLLRRGFGYDLDLAWSGLPSDENYSCY